MERWRARFSIQGNLKFLSQLDLLNTLTRALRRAGIPVRQSSGFNPHMLISFGPAHAVGIESGAEYFDIDTEDGLSEIWYQGLNLFLPEDIRILEARKISPQLKALMSDIGLASYIIDIDCRKDTEQRCYKLIKDFLAAETYVIERVSPKRRKEIDLREGVKELCIERGRVFATVSCNDVLNIRPEEIVRHVFPGFKALNYCRQDLFVVTPDGEKHLP